MQLRTSGLVLRRAGGVTLDFPDFTLEAGQRLLLLGPSGSGKTSLLSMLAGLLPPSAGKVLVDGEDFHALPARERDRRRGRRFGFVFQTLHLLPSLTLRQNVALPASMAGVPLDVARLDGLLASLGLAARANHRPDSLSQGEQQRAAIARAVLLKPAVIIADEPTSALDDANAARVMALLEAQSVEAGASLLVATHDNRITDRFPAVVRLQAAHTEVAA